jgi:CRP-like cAMP-binding protein
MELGRLEAFPLLAKLPAAELDELVAVVSEVDVDTGATVVTRDDYGAAVYFVEDGEAEVQMEGGEGRAIGPRDTFGEISLLLTGERTATVVARTPMRLLMLSDQDFQLIRERVPELESSLRRLGVDRAGR